MEELLGLRLANSIVAGFGDLLVLGLFLWILRIRSPRLRRVAIGAAILHCVAALFYLSPISIVGVSLRHDGEALWYGLAQTIDFWVVCAWLAVAAVLLARRLRVGARSLRALRGLATLQPDPEPKRVAEVERLATRLGVPAPQLVMIPGTAVTPFVAGLRQPMLVVGDEVADALTDEEWRAVVAHELVHIKHRDTWRSFILEVMRTLLWLHLPLQLLVRRYRQELEKSRDLDACAFLAARRSLAAGLVKVSAGVLRAGRGAPMGCAAYSTLLLPRPQQTVDRLRALARRPRGGRWLLVAQCALLVMLLPWQVTVERNSVCISYDPRAGGVEDHSTVLISAGFTTNPCNRWMLRALSPSGKSQ